jgi:hypothetical protein
MCDGLAERRLDETLAVYPVPDQGNPYQHAVDILNGIYVDDQQETVDFLQICQFRILSYAARTAQRN